MPDLILPHNGWRPRHYQEASWKAWERGCKRSLLIWHRRAGKDDVALHKACIAAHQRPANYWHCLPEYAQARKAIWDAVSPHTGRRRIDEAFPHELRESTNATTMSIRFKSGAAWQVVGSDNPDSLVGSAPAGIVFSEAALSNPSAWAFLRPILDENNGWAEFITTPRGRNWIHAMHGVAQRNPWSAGNPDGWFSEVLPYTATGAISAAKVEDARAEYHALYGMDAGDAMIQQEYECSFEAAILGAYYGRELRDLEQDGRICPVDVEARAPVHVAWDLGIHDSMSLWFFQVVGRELRIVDWYEANGQAIEHFVQIKRTKGYAYGHDWVPHDAKVRELGTGRSRVEVMASAGLNPRLIPAHMVADGIQAARMTLARCFFDETRCADGIERLRQYRRDWDDDKKCFKDTPRHDWTSHTADAFRYLAMAWRELTGGPAQHEIPRAPAGVLVPRKSIAINGRSTVRIADLMPKELRRD